MLVIAVDGPAGAGKSTVARAVAARLGLEVLETGAMYRALTAVALGRGIDPTSGAELARLAREVVIAVGDVVEVDGRDVTAEIRGPHVGRVVSTVAAHHGVRSEMVRRQREWIAAHGGGVVEGRDIGSVVFPEADVKVFLTASNVERARRRVDDEAAEDVARRDSLDSNRATSPLKVADNALVIDTTARDIDGIVDEIMQAVAKVAP